MPSKIATNTTVNTSRELVSCFPPCWLGFLYSAKRLPVTFNFRTAISAQTLPQPGCACRGCWIFCCLDRSSTLPGVRRAGTVRADAGIPILPVFISHLQLVVRGQGSDAERDGYMPRKRPRMRHLRYRIETAQPSLAAPGMTARNSPQRHPRPTQPAVARHRDCGIFRASRLKTTSARHGQQRTTQGMQPGRNPSLIEAGQPLDPRRTPLLTSCHGSRLHHSVASAPVVPRETPAAHRAQSEKIRLPTPCAADAE